MFPETISHKTFETNSSFRMKYALRKSLIAIFWNFFASISKTFILAGQRALVYHFMKFRHFPNIPKFLRS